MLQLRGQIHSPYFYSMPLYVLCGCSCVDTVDQMLLGVFLLSVVCINVMQVLNMHFCLSSLLLNLQNSQYLLCKMYCNSGSCTEAEFLDVIGTKVLRVFLPEIHSHLYKKIFPPPPPPEQKWFETGL